MNGRYVTQRKFHRVTWYRYCIVVLKMQPYARSISCIHEYYFTSTTVQYVLQSCFKRQSPFSIGAQTKMFALFHRWCWEQILSHIDIIDRYRYISTILPQWKLSSKKTKCGTTYKSYLQAHHYMQVEGTRQNWSKRYAKLVFVSSIYTITQGAACIFFKVLFYVVGYTVKIYDL